MLKLASNYKIYKRVLAKSLYNAVHLKGPIKIKFRISSKHFYNVSINSSIDFNFLS